MDFKFGVEFGGRAKQAWRGNRVALKLASRADVGDAKGRQRIKRSGLESKIGALHSAPNLGGALTDVGISLA